MSAAALKLIQANASANTCLARHAQKRMPIKNDLVAF